MSKIEYFFKEISSERAKEHSPGQSECTNDARVLAERDK